MISDKLLSVGGGGYWIALLSGGSFMEFDAVVVDSQDNIISGGRVDGLGAGDQDGLVVKYDSLGSLMWSRVFGGISYEEINGLDLDTSENIIFCGVTYTGAPSGDTLISKLDSSGSLLWSKSLAGSDFDFFLDVAVDSSDRVFTVGFGASGGSDGIFAKYDDSGVLDFGDGFGGSGASRFYGVEIGSTNTVIAAGQTTVSGAGSLDALICQFTAGGVILWQRTLGGSDSEIFFDVVRDSAGNIIAVGDTESFVLGVDYGLIAKYTSGGSLLWTRVLDNGSGGRFTSAAIDSQNNIVVVGTSGSSSLIAKYDSSGTLLWTRSLGGFGIVALESVTVDSQDNIIASGRTSTEDYGLICKLPPDGSGTGAYGGLTYEEASFTGVTPTLTDAAASLSYQSTTFSDLSKSLTDSSVSLTEDFFSVR